ncbi:MULTISPECIES: LLM class flavin-dependent oxidoreductase [unclassified Chelatococcus]|uniref:LLM class flavin-dependent oxidoreductase n=1 Tax=unclassified Chelatococcus TaxID=2638111 RepID=UPI001BCB9A62|nr:LLM class flavin-dependent oxidoreductase [Chelatococcus sp.]MBS7698555.1 LLM class flavin-dependent oxidoreductase [Chelatococcus sp. YT9]MBX3554794.1 LLM class flavin-dependent oxidoreductase [Chelatococcus sp.]
MRFKILAIPFARQYGENVQLAGRDPQRFQTMMVKLRNQMVLAEELGYEGFCLTEHHMQVEGIECTTNPLFWNLYIAQHTKNFLVGQLGMNLTAMNPIVLAENIAMLDHMSGGRVFAGFSRGNTPRWTATMGQHLDLTSAESDKSAADQRNRRALYENWRLVKSLWTDDLTSFEGEFWNMPQPVEWNFNPTRDWGGPDAVDAQGILRRGGIVPKPLQTPYPAIYAPFSYSMETARFWAAEGAKMVSFVTADKESFMPLILENCIEAAHAAGRTSTTNNNVLALGAHLLMGKTPEKAKRYQDMFHELFAYAYDAPPYHVPTGRIWGGSRQETLDNVMELAERYKIEEFFLWHHVGYFGDDIEQEALIEFAEGVIHKVNS